jgi:hypothetical protein
MLCHLAAVVPAHVAASAVNFSGAAKAFAISILEPYSLIMPIAPPSWQEL